MVTVFLIVLLCGLLFDGVLHLSNKNKDKGGFVNYKELPKEEVNKIINAKKEEEEYDFSGPVKGVEIRRPKFGVVDYIIYVMIYVEDEINKTLNPIGLEERFLYGHRQVEGFAFNAKDWGEENECFYKVNYLLESRKFIKCVKNEINTEQDRYEKRLEKLNFVPHTVFFNGNKNLKWEKELLCEPEGEMKDFLEGVHRRVIQNPLPILNVNNQLPPPRKEPTPELGLELGELVEPAIESMVELQQLFINRHGLLDLT
jgi:hypothetical protein